MLKVREVVILILLTAVVAVMATVVSFAVTAFITTGQTAIIVAVVWFLLGNLPAQCIALTGRVLCVLVPWALAIQEVVEALRVELHAGCAFKVGDGVL